MAAAAIVICLNPCLRANPQEQPLTPLPDLIPPELRFEERHVPLDENAYPLLLEAVNAFVDLPDDEEDKDLETAFFDSYEADAALPDGPLLERLTAWMARNDEALAQVAKAVDRGQLVVLAGEPSLSEKLNDLRKLAHIFRLRSRVAASKGDFPLAVVELRTPLSLWRLVRGGGGSLTYYMFGMGLEAVTLSEARRLAHEPRATAVSRSSASTPVSMSSPSR